MQKPRQLIPPLEHLQEIVSTTHAFVRQIYESGLIADHPPIGFTAEAMESRSMLILYSFQNWEGALNRLRKPAVTGSPYNIVSDWPDVTGMMFALNDLYWVFIEIVRLWKWESAVGRDRLCMTRGSVNVAGVIADAHLDASHVVPIPMTWAEQLSRVATRLADAIQHELSTRSETQAKTKKPRKPEAQCKWEDDLLEAWKRFREQGTGRPTYAEFLVQLQRSNASLLKNPMKKTPINTVRQMGRAIRAIQRDRNRKQ